MKIFLPALALALIAAPAKAQQCDVNLLTGLDIPASVGASGIEMQVAGMAEALSSPASAKQVAKEIAGSVSFAVQGRPERPAR